MSNIYLVGTADTKSAELKFLKKILGKGKSTVKLVDLSTTPHSYECDVSAAEVAGYHPVGKDYVLGSRDRGTAVAAMGEAFANFCNTKQTDISGIIGIGGGGGTAMVTAGMRQLPYGIPKIMVSTLASGDTSPYVDTSDIMMVPSITDIAGLNFLSRMVLQNAAASMLGMMSTGLTAPKSDTPTIGLSMFGVTTPCVSEIDRLIKTKNPKNHDGMVFHATGIGGRTMEKLLLEGHLEGLIDITTTEIADHICGGILSAGPKRLDAVAAVGMPYVGAPGALDMVNFWAPETVPLCFKNRQFYHHNSNVTLMRTTSDECHEIGQWIANKLNACEGPVRFLIPEKGISALDIEGGEFWSPESNRALFDALEETLITTDSRKLVRLPLHINDPQFAAASLETYFELSKA